MCCPTVQGFKYGTMDATLMTPGVTTISEIIETLQLTFISA